MEIIKKILLWILTVLGVMFALTLMPSISSVLLILFALLIIPFDPIQDFLYDKNIYGGLKVIVSVVLFFAAMIVSPPTSNDTVENKPQETTEESRVNDEAEQSKPEPESKPESVVLEQLDTSDYMKLAADVLFDYGQYMAGKKVVTSVVINSFGTDEIKAKTDNNDGFFFSIICKFESGKIGGLKEGDNVTVAGTVEEKLSLGTFSTATVTLNNCSVIGRGEIAQELKNNAEEQRKICKGYEEAYHAEIASAKKEERDTYVAECVTVSYSDVERNPDSYDGKKIKISGKVVQVSEGWFDTVTLRVDCSGNMWYVTYKRKEGESRILEGDTITGYGECDGVQSYINVLGAQITIPSLKMQYYS